MLSLLNRGTIKYFIVPFRPYLSPFLLLLHLKERFYFSSKTLARQGLFKNIYPFLKKKGLSQKISLILQRDDKSVAGCLINTG